MKSAVDEDAATNITDRSKRTFDEGAAVGGRDRAPNMCEDTVGSGLMRVSRISTVVDRSQSTISSRAPSETIESGSGSAPSSA
ncbi:hypothetical protein JOB18_008804 [Solea senegalensis]|uniref:Uncharacterized protein n=1 Tax=Solea senegalensis TaxID=28829 RepID=A0AAV6R8W7_SOLSE|nr:hypothetical protein JOB18_008804 [Solea senegalensis]